MRICFILLIVFVLSCSVNFVGNVNDTYSTLTHLTEHNKGIFPLPDIPSVIATQDELYSYLLKHYWDEFNFSDSLLLNNKNIIGEGIVGYITLIYSSDSLCNEVNESMKSFCRKLSINDSSRNIFLELMEMYLYNPNSPYYNETIFSSFLKEFIAVNKNDKEIIIRPQFLQKLINRNMPETNASPFNYYLADGTKTSLFKTPINGKYLILLFYDPECINCQTVLSSMKSNFTLSKAIDEKKISVLAIYTEGNKGIWEGSIKDMPQNWILGTDNNFIKDNAIYDLKAMPSIYLLDHNKKVILKDSSWEKVMYYLDIVE